MSLDTLINVTVSQETAALDAASFGTPLILGFHDAFVDRVRTYDTADALTSLVADGIAADDPIYLCAQAIASQRKRPAQIKVGRKAAAPTKTIRLTPVATAEGFVYEFDVEGVAISYTVGAAATVAAICTALQALVDAVTGVNASDDTTHVTVTRVTAGDPLSVISQMRHTEMQVADLTADAATATDLDAIEAVDADWYALVMASQSAAEITAAAAWIESRRKIFVASTQDTACLSGASTTDIMYTQHALEHARTLIMFHENPYSFPAAALLASQLSEDPGASTWAYKSLNGISFSPLTASDKAAIKAKKGVPYVRIAGRNVTLDGWSTAGEFMDVTRFIDWDVARRQERLFGLLVTLKKIPFTAKGIGLVAKEMEAQNQAGVAAGGISAGDGTDDDPSPSVSVPTVAQVSTQDRASRLLPDVSASYRLAGAIHTLDVGIKVSV